MQKSKREEYIELLQLNDENELKKFINSEGKEPKAICPIRFVNQEEIKEEKENGR